MGRPSNEDRAIARQLTSWIGRIEDGAPPILAALVKELRDVLDTERVVAYGVGATEAAFELRFAHWAGFATPPATLTHTLRNALAAVRGPWALFDPRCPEPAQRNRVIVIPRGGRFDPAMLPRLGLVPAERDRYARRMQRLEHHFLRHVGMDERYVCRTVICDGPRVLGWIGACQPTAFGARDRMLLQALIAPLQRRLATERVLGEGPLALAALGPILDALSDPACIVGATGRIEHANAAARALDRTALRAAIANAVRGHRGTGVELTPLGSAGMPAYALAIVRHTARDLDTYVARASARWRLTAREVEVLARIVRGDPNKDIAAELGITTRAVELHVTHLLEKSSTSTRAALAARFYQG